MEKLRKITSQNKRLETVDHQLNNILLQKVGCIHKHMACKKQFFLSAQLSEQLGQYAGVIDELETGYRRVR